MASEKKHSDEKYERTAARKLGEEKKNVEQYARQNEHRMKREKNKENTKHITHQQYSKNRSWAEIANR